SWPVIRASSANRRAVPDAGVYLSSSTLTATSRPNTVSMARYTAPMPPRAISSPSAYRGPLPPGDDGPGGSWVGVPSRVLGGGNQPAGVASEPKAAASPASRPGSDGGVGGSAAWVRVGSGVTARPPDGGVHPRFADVTRFAEEKTGKRPERMRRQV